MKTFQFCKWLLAIYIISRFVGIYPIDLMNKKSVRLHITHLEGIPGWLDNEYYIYSDKGEFINRDSSLLGKFNSHDIQNYMYLTFNKKERLDCDAVVAGVRLYGPGKLSFLQNIISIQCD
jgi:hypothetical protein